MVLYLRLNGRAELTVVEAWGSVEAFEDYLNQHTSWMFQQKERRFIHGKWITYPVSVVLLCGDIKLVLSKPIITCDGDNLFYYNRIITVLRPNRDDRADALGGNEIKEKVEIQPEVPDSRLQPPTPIIKQITEQKPASISTASTATTAPPETATEKETKPTTPTTTPKPSSDDDRLRFIIAPTCPKCETNLTPGRGLYCQQCALKLPPELAVHPEIVVAIKRKDYDKLATHLKQAVNVAWNRLMRGRKVDKTLCSMGQNIFLIAIKDELRASNEDAEQELDSILTNTGIGRLTTDPYELREARKMLEQSKSTS